MDLHRETLLNAMSKLEGIATRESGPGNTFSYVKFTNNEIQAVNLEMSMSVDFESNMNFAVQFDILYKLLSKIQSEKVSFDLLENVLDIRADRHKSRIALGELEDFPKIDKDRFSNWRNIPDNFVDSLKYCLLGASNIGLDTIERPELSGVRVCGNDLVGTDGWKIVYYKLSDNIGDLFLPIKSVQKVLKLGNPNEYAVDGNDIALKYNDCLLILRSSDFSRYPNNWRDLIPKGNLDMTDIPEDLDDLSRSFKRIIEFSKFSSEKDVKLYGKNNKFLCKYESEIGLIEETLIIDLKNEFNMIVNPKILYDGLLNCDEYCIIEEGNWFTLYFRSKDNIKKFLMRAKKVTDE